VSMLFASTYPEKVLALVLCMTTARWTSDVDFPCGALMERNIDWGLELVDNDGWGQGRTLWVFGRSLRDDPRACATMGKWERMATSPGGARALLELDRGIDVRPVLSAITAPTLVIHRSQDDAIDREASRYLVEHIVDARYFEQPGEHLFALGDFEAIADQVEEFLTRARPRAEPDRVLATVLFTDIVGSTHQAAQLGDRRWRDLLDAHHAVVRKHLELYRGDEVNTAGDGFLASFDGTARAIRCACAVRNEVRSLGIEIRAGLHTGEVERRGTDLAGIAVHIGARVAAAASSGEVLASRTVKDLVVGSDIEFADRGEHELKGVPGTWRLYAVAS
jgi:class 3 adenylate cyclase